MTDLEMVTACALAMGLEPYSLNGTAQHCGSDGIYVADKMQGRGYSYYSPLIEDEQAMALEDWLIERGELIYGRNTMLFNSYDGRESAQYPVMNKAMLRRAICECVAKIASGREGES